METQQPTQSEDTVSMSASTEVSTEAKTEKPKYTLPDPLHTFVEDQAAPTRIQVTLPKDKMKVEMDAQWNQFLESLTDGQIKALTKGGYRKITKERVFKKFGGMENFYTEMLHDAVRVEAVKKGRDVLTTASIAAQEVDHGFVVQAVVYLEPTVKFVNTPPATFKVRMAELTDQTVQTKVDQRFKQLQEQHALFVPVTRSKDTGGLRDGDYVTLTLEAYIKEDSKLEEVKAFAMKNQRVQYNGNANQAKPFFLDRELALTGGELGTSANSWDVPAAEEGQPAQPFTGKHFYTAITIEKVEQRELPAIDDELAVSTNWESLAQMKTQFTKDAEDELTREREDFVTRVVLNSLMQNSTVSPIPEIWARRRADSLVAQQVKQFGGEKRLCQMFGVADTGQLNAMHYNQLRNSLRMQLVLRAWGILHNVPGDTSLGATQEYTQALEKHILNTIEIEDAAEGQLQDLVQWWPEAVKEA
jgi:hypothetical protein